MKVCDHTGSAQGRETGVGRMRATQLSTRWKCAITLAPHKLEKLVLAACVLHNYLRDESVRSHWLRTRSRNWCWPHACYTTIYAMKVYDHTGSAQGRETGVGRMRATELPTRWKCAITLAPHKVEKLVLAACVLHNYLRDESVRHRNVEDTEDPVTHNVIPGAWRSDPTLKQVSLPSGTNARLHAMAEWPHTKAGLPAFWHQCPPACHGGVTPHSSRSPCLLAPMPACVPWRSDPTLKQVSLPSGTNARLRAMAECHCPQRVPGQLLQLCRIGPMADGQHLVS